MSDTFGGSTFGTTVLGDVLKAYASKLINSVYVDVTAPGYAAHTDTRISKQNGLITNPWGVNAVATLRPFGPAVSGTVNLAPGQTYDSILNKFSNPNLSGTTVKRLNEATALRRVNESGQQQDNRENRTALATLDEQYIYNANSLPPTSEALSQQAIVNAQGVTPSARTLLTKGS